MDRPLPASEQADGSADVVSLQGVAGALVLPAELWDALLDVAEEYGWESPLLPALYRGTAGLKVPEAEAAELADRLRQATDDLDGADRVPRGLAAPWHVLRRFRPLLAEFTRLCQAGGFSID